MSYLIYGKVVQPTYLPDGKGGKIWHEPHAKFAALTYGGRRVSRLADADDYATREDAQEVINRVKARLKKEGREDCIEFQIRKAK